MSHILIFILCVIFGGTLCANLKPSTYMSTDDTIDSLKLKINTMEERLLCLESKEKENLSEKGRDELSVMVRDAVEGFLEDRSELATKIKEIHIDSRHGMDKRSVTLEELHQSTMKHKEDVDKRLSDMEITLEEMSVSFDRDKNRLLMTDNHLLIELREVQKKIDDALEKIRRVENETKRALERDRLNIESLEVKENLTRILITSHINSQRDVEEAIRKNMTSSADTLKLHISESLLRFENMQSKLENVSVKENLTRNLITFHIDSQRDVEEVIRKNITSLADTLRLHISGSLLRFENMQSKLENVSVKDNLTRILITSHIDSQREVEEVFRKKIKSLAETLRLHINESSLDFENLQSNFTKNIRSLQNSLSEFENEYVKVSLLSKLDEDFRNLDKTTKAELKSTQAEIYPRVKKLEERCQMCDDVAVIDKTLKNHTSEIGALSGQLFDLQNSCSEPPEIENGFIVKNGKRQPDRKHGSTVIYTCRGDWILRGSGEMVCRFGEWTGVLPQCVSSSCGGDLPSLRNGKLMSFERKHGSKAAYVCDENFYTVGISTVRCSFGEWVGRPPVCRKFDASFYAEAIFNYGKGSITCHSDENSNKIEFSRAIDTGSGGSLPENTTTGTSGPLAVMDFNITWYNITGVYQCGFEDETQSMKIVVPLQYDAYLYFPDRFKVANVGDDIELRLFSPLKHRIIWNHDGVSIPSWENKTEVEIRNVQLTDTGIYHCYYEKENGEKDTVALLTLNVRKCQANLYGEHCDQKCPPCYNGGICHDIFGICVCPSGFIGNNCEKACPEGYHGANCSTKTRNPYHCKPHPLGCSCNPGFTGSWCQGSCEAGWYGAGCNQPCHCANGSRDCNRFTGACSGGCEQGWTGESCQIKVLK